MAGSSADILRAARKRIEAPERWTQGTLARTQTGAALGADKCPVAARCCALGAYYAVDCEEKSLGRVLLDRALGETTFNTFAELNDGRDGRSRGRCHREVLALYDRAIELAEAGNQ